MRSQKSASASDVFAVAAAVAVAVVIIFLSSIAFAKGESPSGGYFALRAGQSDGSTKFQNTNSLITGTLSQLEVGWRPGSLLKLGIFGMYENLTLKQNNLGVGRLDLTGYGAQVRIFPLGLIFIEAGGGNTQARYEESATAAQIIGNASFHYVGPGVEVHFGKSFSIDFTFRSQTINFLKNEFQNTRSTHYLLALNFYF